jgi:hypothetical protein
MRVSPHPPHRSRRAELPHRALASGHDAKTNLWIGVANSGGRKPLGNQTLHPFPPQAVLLAAASQNLHPHPADFPMEDCDAPCIRGNSEVAGVAGDQRSQIRPLSWHRFMHPSPELGSNFFELCRQLLSDRFAQHHELPASGFSADMW